MTEPCKGCNEDQNLVYREGKILMRFIGSVCTRPLGNPPHLKDGEVYWMHPRYAQFLWWEPVDDIPMPFIKEAREEESVYEATRVDDPRTPAYIGPSGMSLQSSGRVSGEFAEPTQVVIESELPCLESKEAPVNLGFPHGESPSQKWLKEELFLFIKSRGGAAKMKMKKDKLLSLALNLT